MQVHETAPRRFLAARVTSRAAASVSISSELAPLRGSEHPMQEPPGARRSTGFGETGGAGGGWVAAGAGPVDEAGPELGRSGGTAGSPAESAPPDPALASRFSSAMSSAAALLGLLRLQMLTLSGLVVA